MLTQSTTLAALGPGTWVPVDPSIAPFSLDLACSLSSGGSLTYKVQYTTSPLRAKGSMNGNPNASWSRSGTTLTVTLNGHGLTGTTDSVVIAGSGNGVCDGTFAVASVVDANNFTVTVTNSGATSGVAYVTPLVVFDHATITGKTANFDGSQATPVTAVRLNTTIYASGTLTLTVTQARK